jgi:hypothetical protein
MDEASPRYEQRTLWDTDSATGSPGLQGGATPSPSPDGQTTGLSGQPPVPANRSRLPGNRKARKTNGTSGRFCPPSSASVVLTSWLGNRLVELLDTHGSMEYELTWSRKATPSGLRIFRLRAVARRTSGKGCTGWPSPTAQEAGSTPEAFLQRKRDAVARGSQMGICLTDLGLLAKAVEPLSGWATPRAEDSESTGAHAGTPDTLTSQARVSGWNTPTVNDAKQMDATTQDAQRNLSGQARHLTPGPTTASSPAGTARPAASALNPAMPRYLMAFPRTWDHCSPHWDSWDIIQRILEELSGRPGGIGPCG